MQDGNASSHEWTAMMGERDLTPILKSSHDCWETLNEAKTKLRPPTALGMPLMHSQES